MFGSIEGAVEITDWVLQVCIFEFLLENAAECGTTATGFEDEVALRIRQLNDPRLQLLFFKIFKLLVDKQNFFDEYRLRNFVELIDVMRERRHTISVVV